MGLISMEARDPIPIVIVMVFRFVVSRATEAPLITTFVSSYLGYDVVGCYKDQESRAIRELEEKDRAILDEEYKSRKNPIAKCAVAAMRAGYSMFAVQDGGQCVASATASQTYDKYGKSTACEDDGEGGAWANQVYTIRGN